MERYCGICERDVRTNDAGVCPECDADLAGDDECQCCCVCVGCECEDAMCRTCGCDYGESEE